MPAKFPRFRAGETFGLFGPKGELILDKRAADLFNAAAAEMRRLGNVSATAPLRWVEDKSGRLFSVDMPQVILAKLSGSGATYTFVQQQYDKVANTFSDMTGGRTGTVYESTGKTGLSGKVVLIEYQPGSNDWRFQWVGYGPPPPCETGRICVTVTATGCSFSMSGVNVTVKDSEGTEIGSGPAVGSPAVFCCDIPTAGTYDITVSVPGATDRTASVNAVCGEDNEVAVAFSSGTVGKLCYNFTSCDQDTPFGGSDPYPGVLLTVTGPGGATGTATSDSSGNACVILGVGTWTSVATFPRGLVLSLTPSAIINSCATNSRTAPRVTFRQGFSASAFYPASCDCTINVRNLAGTTVGSGVLELRPDGGGTAVGVLDLDLSPEILTGTATGKYDVLWPASSVSVTNSDFSPLCSAYHLFGAFSSPLPCSDPP